MESFNQPQIVEAYLGEGEDVNRNTVVAMSHMAQIYGRNASVRELALEILRVAKVPSQDYVHEAFAIGEFVKRGFRYVKDCAGVEQVYSPVSLFNRMERGAAQGDCDDHACAIAALLISIGHNPYFRIIKYRTTNPSFNHIYVVDYVTQKVKGRPIKVRVVLDAILKDKPIGYEIPHAYGEEISAFD